MSQDKRNYPRTSIKMEIQLTLESGEEILGETWDISDGGIAFSMEPFNPQQWHSDMVVSGQLQNLPMVAPIIKLTVVWVGSDSLGLAIVPT
jgi:c-di-GMP-binding flagellar brake protein YcgR